MKIAFVSQPFDYVAPQASASVTIWTNEVTRRLARSHELIVYGRRSTSQEGEEAAPRGRLQAALERHRDVLFQRFPVGVDAGICAVLKRVYKSEGRDRERLALVGSPLYYVVYALQVALDLRRRRVDLAHVHNFSQFVPLIQTFAPSTRIVLHMHCEWLTEMPRAPIARRLRHADAVIGCSDHITESIRRTFPQIADRCSTLPNGVDVERFAGAVDNPAPDETGRQLLFVGRLSPEKGVHVLIDAFRRIGEVVPDVRLCVVGPEYRTRLRTSYRRQLEDMLSPAIRRRVSFTGFVPHEAIAGHYRQASILVNPSLTEAFGMPLVEAMAAGVPVVGTRTGGMAEIVDGVGVLVEPGDPAALADAILRLLRDPALRKRLGEAGRQRAAERFSWDRVVETLERRYATIFRDRL